MGGGQLRSKRLYTRAFNAAVAEGGILPAGGCCFSRGAGGSGGAGITGLSSTFGERSTTSGDRSTVPDVRRSRTEVVSANRIGGAAPGGAGWNGIAGWLDASSSCAGP